MNATQREEWVEHTRRRLAASGTRSGAARAAVVDLLARQSCALSAREIGDGLRADGRKVGQASVYRALELLDELHLVQRLDTGTGTARYEAAHPSGEHHHHVVCDSCGVLEPVSDDSLEDAIDRLARRLDFEVAGHEVVLHGECRECRTVDSR